MAYILEQSEEFERLEKQNADPEFDPEFDFSCFYWGDTPMKVVDLGCGSGAMTETIAKKLPSTQVVGVDVSELRVHQLKNDFRGSSNVEFLRADATQLPFESDSVDVILMRYVVQHLTPEAMLAAFAEVKRCLRVGGRLLIQDVDGYLESLQPMGPWTRKTLNLLQDHGVLDLKVAPKLPNILSTAGFSKVDWKIDVVSFQGSARERAVTRTLERIDNARLGLLQLGYSDADFESLRGELFESLSSPVSVCFMNRFYIMAEV